MDGQFRTETTHPTQNFDAGRVRHGADARHEPTPAVRPVEYGSGWYHETEIARARTGARHA